MNNNRLTQLLKFHEEDPEDAFTIYAIGLEYIKSDLHKALHYLERLYNEFPRYLAGYYHLAALYVELGELKKAENLYREGIRLAKELNDNHTLKELNNAYNTLKYDDM